MSKVHTLFHRDGDKLHVERVQDVEAVLEQAKRLHIEGKHGSKEMRHAARYPRVIVEAYCNKAGITLNEWMANPVHAQRMLDDPDLAYFKIGA